MKVLVAIALCGLVAVAYAALDAQPEAIESFAFTPECPSVDGEDLVLIANPENCKGYYACDNGYAIRMGCSPGLHFNDKLKVCDRPENACCDPVYDPEKKCKKSF